MHINTKAKLTKSKVQVEGGHGRSKGVSRRFPGLPKRQRVLGSVSSSSGVARPQQWRQEVRARGIETEPCRRRGILMETVVDETTAGKVGRRPLRSGAPPLQMRMLQLPLFDSV